MKTDSLEMKRRGAAGNLFAVVSLPLCFAAGCVMQEPGTATATQDLGTSCFVQRPVAWDGAATACLESRSHNTPIVLLDGDSYFTTAVPFAGTGVGEVTLTCDNGKLDPDPWDDICIPNRGGGGGTP